MATSVKSLRVFTFQLLLFVPVRLRPPHGLDELDEEGDSLVHVLLAERVSFHRVITPIDLHHRDRYLTHYHKLFKGQDSLISHRMSENVCFYVGKPRSTRH